MAEPIIWMNNVHKDYVNDDIVTPVLHGVALSIEPGEFVAIMGRSGSGKSTLMHIMGFLDRLTEGEYRFKGRDVSTLSNDELAQMRRDEVGFVFQFFNLLADSTVLDNVMLPLMYSETNRAKRLELAKKAVKEVGLDERAQYLANQLSGGERQRVAIARAMVNEPSVIFADEPTGNLDTKTGLIVLELLQDLNEEGHTIVMVTHEEEAAHFARRIIRLRDGQIVSDERNHTVRRGEFNK